MSVAGATIATAARHRAGGHLGRAWLRAGAGAAILAGVVVVVGAEPFLRGIASISPASVAVALALAAVATAAAAWRWRVLAGRLGLALGWRASIAAYYRSQFLNTVLPGGVVGDVHRAVAHGQSVQRVGQASRAVVVERAAGQVVQLVLAFVVLAVVGASAYAPAMGIVLVAVAVVTAVAAIATVSGRARAAIGRELRVLRGALGSVRTVLSVAAASVLVVAAHVTTFVLACVVVGVDAPADRLAVAAVVAVLASSIPLSLGGWGPREGAAAWAFGAVGLGAAAGLAAATAYGILAMIAVTPGALVLVASALRRRRASVASVAAATGGAP